MQTVRSPQEILSLYNRLKEKKKRAGRAYLKKEFVKNIGYKHPSRFTDITTGKQKISLAVNKLMDYLEDSL